MIKPTKFMNFHLTIFHIYHFVMGKLQTHFLPNNQNKSRTSTILVPAGDQDPTVNLTHSFWMAVDPPILVANHI